MSMTKRQMDAERERQEKQNRDNCGCVFNWDDKFWQECPEHAGETKRRMDEEAEIYCE